MGGCEGGVVGGGEKMAFVVGKGYKSRAMNESAPSLAPVMESEDF